MGWDGVEDGPLGILPKLGEFELGAEMEGVDGWEGGELF